jgi:hypothetical protein
MPGAYIILHMMCVEKLHLNVLMFDTHEYHTSHELIDQYLLLYGLTWMTSRLARNNVFFLFFFALLKHLSYFHFLSRRAIVTFCACISGGLIRNFALQSKGSK